MNKKDDLWYYQAVFSIITKKDKEDAMEDLGYKTPLDVIIHKKEIETRAYEIAWEKIITFYIDDKKIYLDIIVDFVKNNKNDPI